MTKVWRDCGANPASPHSFGRAARRLVEESREGILALLGARTTGMAADKLIFTSGGTEANHLALHGLLTEPDRGLAISALEHPSIQATAEQLRSRGVRVQRIPVLSSGLIDLASIEQLLVDEATRPQLMSLMLASNETGVLQPVAEVSRLAASSQVLVHSDAVQAIGKTDVQFHSLSVVALTVVPHKFHGPIGIGGLLLRNDVQLQPQLFGGFQQGALRPGTESAALAVGFHRALNLAISEREIRCLRMKQLRDQFEATIQTEIKSAVVVSQNILRTPNTTCISFPMLDRQALVMALDLAGVACSTGSACASGSSEPSPSLVAMGLPAAVISSALRFSLSALTTTAEIADAAERIINTVKRLQPTRN